MLKINREVVKLHNGLQLVVADSGPADQAVSVIAIPGWKGTDAGMSRLNAQAVNRGLRIVVINLPGNGISPSSAQFGDLAQLVEVVEETVLELVGREAVILFGHSVGATIATSIAGRHRLTLLGLVLLSPTVASHMDRAGWRTFARRHLLKVAISSLGRGPEAVANAIIRSASIAAVSNATLARRGVRGFLRIQCRSKTERIYAADPKAAAAQLMVAAKHGCAEYADGVDIPTFVLAGDQDPFSSPAELRQFCAAMPLGKLIMIQGAGHLAHHEDLETTSIALADSLKEIESILHA